MPLRSVTLRVLYGAVADALLAAVCYRLQVNLATVSLLYLLSVVIQALQATFLSSVVIALIAASFINYFFIPPILTWRIDDPIDAITLIVFMTTAVVVSQLSSKARNEAKNAERRRRTMEQLYLSSEQLVNLDPETDIVDGILKTYREVFQLNAVCFFDGLTAAASIQGKSATLVEKTREAFISGADYDDPGNGISARSIRTGGKVTAALGFENLRDPDLVARSLVTLTITTLLRARAFQTAGRATAETKTEVFRAAVLDALAHEFKTPLSIILAAAGGLQEGAALTAEERELAGEIETEALRLSRLTSRLLRRVEMEKEEVHPNLEHLDLGALAALLVERYNRRHGERRLRFTDGAAEVVAVKADIELLRLALSQLLDNAIKYSPTDSEIVVSLVRDGPQSHACGGVRVWNSGSSVATPDRSRIFERFYRGSNARRAGPGSGLGLYVARKIATAHGGTLQVETMESPDDGVAFRFMLPITEKELEHAGTNQSADRR
jgi:two-component system sensor histidine kinase KdpD